MSDHPFIDPEIVSYCENHTSEGSKFLHDLHRTTHLRFARPQMMSGNWQGQFLAMLSRIMQPKRILEIGTFSGYATLCLAEGLSRDGIIHTIEREEELKDFLEDLFSKSNHKEKIKLHIGLAQNVIPSLNEVFDLVFLDADKAHYQDNYELALAKMPSGGIMLIDNVLWYGKIVAHTLMQGDKETPNLRAFNRFVQNDTRVENVLLPLRDGIMMVRKK